MSTIVYDPVTGLPRPRGKGLVPDQGGIPDFNPAGAAPQQPSISPSSPADIVSSAIAQLGIPGAQPDFNTILNSDPLLQQTRSQAASQSIADKTQRDALIQQAVIGYGAVPDLTAAATALGISPQDLSSLLTPQVQQLAQQNTQAGLSTTAKLQKELERAQQVLADALAARGALRSSAYGIGLTDLQQSHAQAGSDSLQQLMRYITDYSRGYTEAERARQGQVGAATEAAAGRIDPARLAETPAATATLVDYDAAGKPIYQTPDGRTYTLGPDGNPVPYTPVAPQPADPLAPRQAGGGSRGYVAQ